MAKEKNVKLSKFVLVRQQIGLLVLTLQDPLVGPKPMLSQFLARGLPFLIIGSLILSSMLKCFAVLLKMDTKVQPRRVRPSCQMYALITKMA